MNINENYSWNPTENVNNARERERILQNAATKSTESSQGKLRQIQILGRLFVVKQSMAPLSEIKRIDEVVVA